MLRSNIRDWSPEELWRAYIQLTEAEEAFRIHKSDLRIRPHMASKRGAGPGSYFGLFFGLRTLEDAWGDYADKLVGDEPRKSFSGAFSN